MHTAESLQQAFHYLWPDEVGMLKDLARSLPADPTVVNIGAGAGTSGLAFAESRKDLHLFTIDVQRESSPFGCLEAERQVLIDAGFDVTSYHTRFHQLCADSKNVGLGWLVARDIQVQGWPDAVWGYGMQPVDMVFVDGDHSYEGCRGDMHHWLPNIKPGGILAVHDYGKAEAYKRQHNPADVPHPRPWPGVDQAVDEFMKDFSQHISMIRQTDTLIAFRVNL